MSKSTDNLSAFPHGEKWETIEPGKGRTVNSRGVLEKGMTLRDYFAAKAMQSICAGEGARMVADRDGRYNETNWAEIVAKNSYEFADAMLKERGNADC